jgi:septal ring factor EnvC (AmiA/AmiB activator)
MDPAKAGEDTREARRWLGVLTPAFCVVFAHIAPLAALAGPAPAAPSDLVDKRRQLEQLEGGAGAAALRQRKLESEVADLAAKREQLNRELLDASAKLQVAETRAAAAEQSLATLTARESAIAEKLNLRRGVIGEILAVLQRMGRRPPPALLTRPGDVLETLRGSIALEAALEPMRAEARALQADIAELARVRRETEAEKVRLAEERAVLATRRAKLGPLIEARQAALAEARTRLGEETERMRALATQATSLKELIGRLENQTEPGRRATEAARAAEAARARQDDEQRRRALAAPFQDVSRLAPAVSFANLKGKLITPVSGDVARRYGVSDGAGGKEKGVSFSARENGMVVAPSDGWVLFAGPYRSYGQLLIISAGDGYYVVMAGMGRTNVTAGQFVLAGEPVASMGDGVARTAATIAIGASQPILYVEFRKDGASIDPGPWWAMSDSRKVGG